MELNKLYLMDCMEGMAQFPDKYFDLAIVDPPYGIGMDGQIGACRVNTYKKQKKKQWDSCTPNQNYFDELNRISGDQIIFGANYFVDKITPSMGWIYWGKDIGGNFSDGELIFTSFKRALKEVRIRIEKNRVSNSKEKAVKYQRIHPTQKPVQLYKWILHNYAKPDFKIIDTHVGSGSSIIAFLDFGCEWIGFEIDEDYHKAATKRIEIHKRQLKLF